MAYRLNEGASIWWDYLKETRRREGYNLVTSWRRMQQLLSGSFLSLNYEQYLFEAYQNCLQGNMSVNEYTAKFLRLATRNHLSESDNQQVV